MLKILLVLLPLAASAACGYSDLSACKKCGVGAIGMQFDGSKPNPYCNCNDNAGRYGKMCPKTGAPTLPTCCSVDGKAATVQDCKCGTTTCSEDEMCTADTNTCAYPVCAKTDGSAASTSEKECQCGTTSCSKGEKCTAKTNNCERPPPPTCGSGVIGVPVCKCGTAPCFMTQTCTASSKCESPPPPTCGSGPIVVTACTCGTTTCGTGQTCTASSSTCKMPAPLPACKEDVVVTAKCECGTGSGSDAAYIGQICPSKGDNKGKPQWPACSGSDVFKTKKQRCKCADKDLCTYGEKCTQAGDFKGFCECVASDDVVCLESVPLSDKCPKTCDGHTAIDATTYVLGQCSASGGGYYQMYTAANNVLSSVYYTDSACTTKAPAFMTAGRTLEWPAGCQSSKSTFYSLPKAAASGSTALQVAMPVALVAGLLGSILL